VSLSRVCNRILQDMGEIAKFLSVKSQVITRPPLPDWNMVDGFFDGASQTWGVRCGVGAILNFPVLGVYSIKMNCGFGTNTREEILALWIILFFAHFKQVSSL
jgi:hypothetical protein